MGARAVTAGLGLWLFLSAFLWPHSSAQFYNALITGTLAVPAALTALGGFRQARYLNVVLGGWLLVSAVLLPSTTATLWNHVAVGLGLVLFGLSSTWRQATRREPIPAS